MTDETENYSAPHQMQAAYYRSKEGAQLRYACVPRAAETRPTGTVILLHGRNEALEKYCETISDLNRRGFCVASMDWRGQGGSFRLLKDKQRGYVRRFSDYQNDFEIFLKTIVLPDCPPPYYLIAHSTGALIALASSSMLQSRISRMVLLSPFLGLARSIFHDNQLRPLVGLLSKLGFGRRYGAKLPLQLSPQSFASNPLTHDQQRYLRNAAIIRDHPELGIAGPTIHWLSQVLRAIHSINKPDFFENYTIPTLILVAGADRVVDSKASLRFAAHLPASSVLTIDGAYHELLQESDFYREQVFAAIDAFLPGTNAPEQISEPVIALPL